MRASLTQEESDSLTDVLNCILSIFNEQTDTNIIQSIFDIAESFLFEYSIILENHPAMRVSGKTKIS